MARKRCRSFKILFDQHFETSGCFRLLLPTNPKNWRLPSLLEDRPYYHKLRHWVHIIKIKYQWL